MQILKRDKKENLGPNKGIAVIQRITINWGKDEIQKVYTKDPGAKQLRKQKGTDALSLHVHSVGEREKR